MGVSGVVMAVMSVMPGVSRTLPHASVGSGSGRTNSDMVFVGVSVRREVPAMVLVSGMVAVSAMGCRLLEPLLVRAWLGFLSHMSVAMPVMIMMPLWGLRGGMMMPVPSQPCRVLALP